MPKPRKTLGSVDSPYIVSLTRLLEAQSKPTVIRWCITYAEQNILPIYERACPGDDRPRSALLAAQAWLDGAIKLPVARPCILACHAAAREAEKAPAAQAAARAVGQSASTIHTPTHAPGLAFYGAAAIAYDRIGPSATPAEYEAIAAEVCAHMEATLRDLRG